MQNRPKSVYIRSVFCLGDILGLTNEEEEDNMRLFNKEKKHKRVIRCYSRSEMERLHDKFIERGIKAEESISVIPYSTVNIYKLLVED